MTEIVTGEGKLYLCSSFASPASPPVVALRDDAAVVPESYPKLAPWSDSPEQIRFVAWLPYITSTHRSAP
jgi:hypothetical protein